MALQRAWTLSYRSPLLGIGLGETTTDVAFLQMSFDAWPFVDRETDPTQHSSSRAQTFTVLTAAKRASFRSTCRQGDLCVVDVNASDLCVVDVHASNLCVVDVHAIDAYKGRHGVVMRGFLLWLRKWITVLLR